MSKNNDDDENPFSAMAGILADRMADRVKKGSRGGRHVDIDDKYCQAPEAMAMELQARWLEFSPVRNFKPGYLVEQIASLSMYTVPHAGFPGIVTDVYERKRDDRGAGAELYADMNIAYLVGGDGEYAEFAVDSRRFRMWKEQKAN